MISVDEALKRILDEVKPLEVVEKPLSESLGGTLAETIVAAIPLPPFDNSAMDGYAIRANDVTNATPERPAWLRLVGEVPAGSVFEKSIGPGEAVKIMTGAAVPSTTDAVVMLEEARVRDGSVEICQPVPIGRHIRRKGEDVVPGQKVLGNGTTIHIRHLGLLAGLGRKTVKVCRTPAVSVLSTGSELTEIGQTLESGKIYDSNRLVLRKLIEQTGATIHDLGTVADDPESLKQTLQASAADLLVLSGGVSVGKYDYVKEVLQGLGLKTIFWRVEMKPGKPVLFGRLNHQWVFGLPGNPISCVVCFLLFVRPAIQKMMGVQDPRLPIVQAKLKVSVTKKDARRHYLTACVEETKGERVVAPTSQQGSGMLAALAEANAFIVVPEEKSSLETGELVDVLPFENG